MVTGKKEVLLIAPLFFGYYKEIMRELQDMDYSVTYLCDAPSNSNVSKAIGRVNKNLIRQSAEKYYKEKIADIINSVHFDYVLLVGGMTFAFTPEMMGEIRKRNPNARFIMYQWDSEKNLPYSTHIHPYFDALFSFDMNDCNMSKKYKFLPLFYIRNYEEIGQQNTEQYQYDCSYVGTAHPKKYHDINQIADAIRTVMPRQYIYHYMPSKLKYIYHKLLAPEYRGARYRDFKSEKVATNDLLDIIRQSKCVLDAPQAGQTGLTIRTIECLGAKRKLITTNADVTKYDFYNPSNIYVFNQDNVDLNNEFFANDYEPVDKQIYEKYSLRNWLRTMLEPDQE